MAFTTHLNNKEHPSPRNVDRVSPGRGSIVIPVPWTTSFRQRRVKLAGAENAQDMTLVTHIAEKNCTPISINHAQRVR